MLAAQQRLIKQRFLPTCQHDEANVQGLIQKLLLQGKCTRVDLEDVASLKQIYKCGLRICCIESSVQMLIQKLGVIHIVKR